MTHIVKHNLLVAKGRVSLKHLVQDRRSIEIQLSYIHSLLYFALLKSNDSINFFGSCYKYYPSSPLRALGLSSELRGQLLNIQFSSACQVAHHIPHWSKWIQSLSDLVPCALIACCNIKAIGDTEFTFLPITSLFHFYEAAHMSSRMGSMAVSKVSVCGEGGVPGWRRFTPWMIWSSLAT